MSEDPFVAVRARPAGVGLFAQASVAPSRSSFREFVGEDFIQAYLSPHEVGCGKDHEPDCLCDVDASKTQGMTWDQCPPQLLNVETHEDLVRAAANIWLNYDLADSRVQQKLEWLNDPEKVATVKRLVQEGVSWNGIEEAVHVSLDGHTYAMLRRSLGVKGPSRVKEAWLRKYHAEGLSIEDIRRRIKEVEGVGFHHSTISKALKRIGLQPNGIIRRPRNGTPKGYKRSSGLGYRAWREKYGEG